ncbi:MAG: hypothetical protein J6K42_05180 [Clostridia bacterium]|nr:hypothetical protein [Clostridia bacterium]
MNKKEGKLFERIKTIFKQLTEPENDEIEDVNNEDTNKFIENLKSIQEKTGTINYKVVKQQEQQDKTGNQRSKNKINSRSSTGTSNRDRDD